MVALGYTAWTGELRLWLRRTVGRARIAGLGLLRHFDAPSPDQWFLIGFAVLLLAFLFILLLEPSSVGRGGR